jgi:hypothetical protein
VGIERSDTAIRGVKKTLLKPHQKEADELEGWDDYFNRHSLFEQVITQIDPYYKLDFTPLGRHH